MVTMKIVSLKLANFKGLKSFTLDTRGGNVSIYGDNATGKTTLMDAFFWLLFDKDSANRKDFDIKTLDKAGEPFHGLNHEVEGVFEVDGMELALRKVYAEKWTKRRGSATKEFTGHTVDHFIDGVPVKKGEYESRIKELVSEDAFRLLTDPKHFNEQLHWQERRRILLEVCGDIPDGDVLDSMATVQNKDEMMLLTNILNARSLDDHRKVIAARRAEVNKELSKIPVRIDEVMRGLPDLPEDPKDAYVNVTNILKELKKSAEARLLRIEAGGEVAEKVKALAELEAELLVMRNKLRAGIADKIDSARAQLNEVSGKIDGLNSTIRSKNHVIKDNQNELVRLEARMEKLRAEWNAVNSVTFEFEQDDTCPTCGQVLPKEQQQKAHEKAKADFNQGEAERLEAITVQGKGDRARAEELALQGAELEKEVRAAEGQLKELQKEEADLQERINGLNARAAEDTANDPAYVKKAAGKQVIEDAIVALRAGSREETAAVEAKIAELDTQIAAAKSSLSAFEAHDKGQVRIKELKGQEQVLAAEYERLEEGLFLTEEFIRTKVQLLEERINSRFEHARFKLFNVMVNGGIEECCETLYQGVPYNSALNNAARINVGLDIINTLSEHYSFEAPIWIDNREAVTRLIPTTAQLISLIVSEEDKRLRVEVEAADKPEIKKEAV